MQALSTPWIIKSIYLFRADELFHALRERGVQVGTGTSITGTLWERAEIYPMQRNPALLLSQEQRAMLALFK